MAIGVRAPEHGGGRLGERERGHLRSGLDRPVGRSEQDRDHRLGAPGGRVVDRVHRRAHGAMDRWGVDDEHAVDLAGLDRGAHSVPIVVRRCPPVERDRAGDGSQPGRLESHRREHRRAARVRDDRDAPPAQHRLGSEDAGCVQHRGDARHLDQTGVLVRARHPTARSRPPPCAPPRSGGAVTLAGRCGRSGGCCRASRCTSR